ncbi:hypothetical protein [Streptomyces anandii]|uniref:hypothetical protein n=1 Tax=Streptomyces anandii TaxID=285454 RepID=UPI001674B0DA|nr:hypothetical protein [Streptomyces anandii]GGX93436.1 hypothetical protein GCM10010510_43370 [Streptomyces anandii JCM 4720]
MAHAAPVTAAVTTRGTRTRTHPPDIFGPRAHRIGRWALPFAIGLVYGYWAAANRRSGGPITGWNLAFGFITAIVFTLITVGVLLLGPRLPRELHALLWFAYIGIAFGFLYIQSGETVLLATGLSLGLGAIAGLFCFYWAYTHEDAEGHHI